MSTPIVLNDRYLAAAQELRDVMAQEKALAERKAAAARPASMLNSLSATCPTLRCR